MTSIPLFRREWRLVVGNLDVTGLDMQFHVSKTVKPEPNKAEITIFNLSPEHAAQFAKQATAKASAGKPAGVMVELHAGYKDNAPLIFRGDLTAAATTHDGPDRITKLSGQDGGRSCLEGTINQSFAGGTPLLTLLRACAAALGIGEGNLADAATGGVMDQIGQSYPHGRVLSGSAFDLMTILLAPMGLSWSVQNGVVQVQKSGQPLQTVALRLSPSTGLVGSPSQEIDVSVKQPSPEEIKAHKVAKPKPHTLVVIKTLLIPGLSPGRKVVLDSDQFKGGFQVLQADYIGDTAGDPWNATCKLKAY